jgi:hypothetical protein
MALPLIPINNKPENLIYADGKCLLGNLVLVDRKTGKEWEIYIDDGKIYAEPWDKDERRDHRIEKVLGE